MKGSLWFHSNREFKKKTAMEYGKQSTAQLDMCRMLSAVSDIYFIV